ncbi:zinc finger protein 761-like [Harpegnathos saltator]|uniref:zinc finger protein 761-like n=1 Tax=Harpegnathos saltator TaxID=610380 RepID=UPI00058B6B40|nr:zinc finger protein 761-like [Harpegnathos saltator]
MDMTKRHSDEVERSTDTSSSYNYESNDTGKHSTKGSRTKKYKSVPQQCSICKQMFREKYELMDHFGEVHKFRIHKCNHCNYETKHKHNLTRHEKIHIRKHPSNRGYVCTEPGCNKTYQQQQSMNCHILINDHENKKESNNTDSGPSSECNLCNELSSGMSSIEKCTRRQRLKTNHKGNFQKYLKIKHTNSMKDYKCIKIGCN